MQLSHVIGVTSNTQVQSSLKNMSKLLMEKKKLLVSIGKMVDVSRKIIVDSATNKITVKEEVQIPLPAGIKRTAGSLTVLLVIMALVIQLF